jgi:hypothetical protein
MPIPVVFDPDIGHQFVKYDRLVAARANHVTCKQAAE